MPPSLSRHVHHLHHRATSALYRRERSLGRESGKVANIGVLVCHQLLQNGNDFLLRKFLAFRRLPICGRDNLQGSCYVEPDIRNGVISET
jgi:hypothetical protein